MDWMNRGKPGALTLEALEKTARRLAELGPSPPSEITVSPDIYGALTKAIAAGPDLPLTGVRVHVDELLPRGFWHEGAPRTPKGVLRCVPGRAGGGEAGRVR